MKGNMKQKTQGASVKSGLSDQSKIDNKLRGETKVGQRPVCKKDSAPGPFSFKT